jgi:hypothetical protein
VQGHDRDREREILKDWLIKEKQFDDDEAMGRVNGRIS